MTSKTVRTLPLPPAHAARLTLPDALRGFCLFGTLMANLLGSLPAFAMAGLLALTVASLWIGRAPVLRESIAHRRFWRYLLCVSLGIGLIATMRTDAAHAALLAWVAWVAFFAAAFVLLFQQAAWRRWLQKLAPTGRMALTNFLAQALLGLCLVHGTSLQLDLASLLLCGAAIFALQAMASCWWMARHNAGPVEWLGHSLVRGTRHSMRRPTVDAGRPAALREAA
ncbi:DUF418 domain-containing protein [Variovorax sp. IB41]|uniref:DUF418 domain-containing protein n=1 Tax=Variovorax sp. IB41 TaxID=2779370 RepID=UPI0018E73F43|nr:DUF418 domain-containing protein [Variovorax sp. IB41]MBJ2159926.1 DUF418 domain-containing protein [Variovorax sp. IB41]